MNSCLKNDASRNHITIIWGACDVQLASPPSCFRVPLHMQRAAHLQSNLLPRELVGCEVDIARKSSSQFLH